MDGQSPVGVEEYEASRKVSSETQRRKGAEDLVGREENDDGVMRRRFVVTKRTHLPSNSSSSVEDESMEDEEGSSIDDEEDLDGSEEEDEEDASSEEEEPHGDAVDWRDGKERKLASGKIIATKDYKSSRSRPTHQLPPHPAPAPTASRATSTEANSPPRQPSPPLTVAYLSQISSVDEIPAPHRERRLAHRDTMGIVGLSDHEKRALLATERKMAGMETRKAGGFASAVEAKANCQKHYRIGGSRGGKKMGGLEKRLG